MSYWYDNYSRLTSKTFKYDAEEVYTTTLTYRDVAIDGAAQTTGQVESYNVDAPGLDVTYIYGYDKNGNIVSIAEEFSGLTTSYIYDTAGQLQRENNQAANTTWVWTYDNAGNILTRTEYAYSVDTLGEAVDTVTYGYTDDSWGDLLTSYDGQNITYDTIGNPLSDGTWTYTWEHGRQLASMTDGTTTWTYTYDANGLRTSRSNGTTTYNYIYNGTSLVQMTVGNDTLYFAYDVSSPMTVTYNGVVYYYVTNLQGDVIAILDALGANVVEYSYDAWGSILTTTGSMASTLGAANPLRYRGYVFDFETGLYYLQSRYYNPEIGRFLNSDVLVSTGQGFLGNNMFAYCLNNPIILSDSEGRVSVIAIVVAYVGEAAIDGVISGIMSALGTWVTGGTWDEIEAAFGDGAVESFVLSLLGVDNIGVGLANAASTFSACLNSGASWETSTLASAVAFVAGIGFGTTGDKAVDIAVELTFGLGLSLSSAAVTEAVKGSKSSWMYQPTIGSSVDAKNMAVALHEQNHNMRRSTTQGSSGAGGSAWGEICYMALYN